MEEPENNKPVFKCDCGGVLEIGRSHRGKLMGHCVICKGWKILSSGKRTINESTP